jgi:hypothetical protein
MKAERYDNFPLVRINAPEIYQDPAFKDWFFNRPGWPDDKGEIRQGPPIATWHRPGETELNEYSDIFMTVQFLGSDVDGVSGDGSESDMPKHIWDKLLRGVWEVLGKPRWHVEALVWLSNLEEGRMSPQEHMAAICDKLLANGFSVPHCELLKNLLDRCEVWLDHLYLDQQDFALLSRLGLTNIRADLYKGKVCWVAQFYGPGHRIRPDVKVPLPTIQAPEAQVVEAASGPDETSVWDVDEAYPVADWQQEVVEDNTRLGYRDWVAHQREIASEDESAG